LLIQTDDGPAPLPNKLLIETLTNAHRWLRRVTDGSHRSIRDLAAREGVHPAEISRVLPLVFLAPDITEAILEGRHPVDLTSRELKRLTDLPDDWTDQRRLFS
jgi:site-specific DNA recombinase